MAICGNIALILAFSAAFVQVTFHFLSRNKDSKTFFFIIRSLTFSQAIFIKFSLLVLIYLYVVSDFSVSNVVLNSHSELSLFYKIAGAWSNYEGSMLLWVYILALYGVLAGFFTQSPSHHFNSTVLTCQSIITAGFTLFVIFMANPFDILVTPHVEGQGLTPTLHDPSLGFHPPLLYFG